MPRRKKRVKGKYYTSLSYHKIKGGVKEVKHKEFIRHFSEREIKKFISLEKKYSKDVPFSHLRKIGFTQRRIIQLLKRGDIFSIKHQVFRRM